jgi:GNAT superfamily N-acetyltransferase
MKIRTMTREDLALALDWAAAEGWNPGLADAACFHAADPDGFLVGEVDGTPVGCVSAVRYPGGFGFLGFYIVRPEFRGQGHGMALWRAAMARLQPGLVGLDGVVAQQANYRKSGFILAHRNVRYGGDVNVGAPADLRVQPVTAAQIPALTDYDRRHFPAPRDAFLQAWLRPDRRTPRAYIDNGVVRGYGVIRACRQGHKIGPLFADTPAIAETLFQALAASMPGLIFLDPPEPNGPAVALAQRYGLTPVFETARMYRGPAPQLPLEKIFGITTFELG